MAGEIERAFDRAVAGLESLSSASWFPPAIALIAVTAEQSLISVSGKSNVATGCEATAATPFYIASQTKSFVGVMAALLAADGTLPLGLPLAAIWPALTLPPPADPETITLADLLTHQVPILNDELVLETSYRRDVPAGDYPRRLPHSICRERGYRYDNLGYLIYAAAIEERTGRGWKDLLDELVLQPIGMSRTSARTSAFETDELAWRHLWRNGIWHPEPPKPDALMHAAGGLVASPGDLALWLKANLRGGPPGLGAEIFSDAQVPRVLAFQEDGPFFWRGYGLGQQTGEIEGIPVVGHRGGYEGARSIAVAAPEMGVGFAVMVNSDFRTRDLIDRLCSSFFAELHD